MTWAEFQIRAYAYRRMQEREDLRAREIAWSALIGFHYDPKKLPKTKQKFWQIGENKSEMTDRVKERIKQAQKEYHEQLKAKNGE